MLFRSSALALKDDIFLFTVEELEEEDIGGNGKSGGRVEREVSSSGALQSSQTKGGNWILQKTGRFAHSKKYVETLVRYFPTLSIVSVKSIIPR